MRRLLTLLTLALLSNLALAQQATGTQATTNDRESSAKQDVKDAGKSTKKATKKTTKKVDKETKKAVNKSAEKTSEGAGKVKEKTEP
jgi:Ni/Co efflux regulator RcnB